MKRDYLILVLFLIGLFFVHRWYDHRRGDPAWSPQKEEQSSVKNPLLIGQKIPINSADSKLIEVLPGIGPALAERIIAYREEHGPFRRGEDLLGVPGIGPKKLREIKGLIELGPSP